MFPERKVKSGGLTLRVAEGLNLGAPMIVLHGVTRCWQDFLPILPTLAARYRIHAPDFRGHGRSDRTPDGAYRAIDYVADIVALLDHLTEPAVLVGHSLGAMVAAAVAATSPDWVRAVILEDPPFEMMGSRIGETFYIDLFRACQSVAGSDRPVREIVAELAEVPLRPPGASSPIRLAEIRDAASLRFGASCLRRLDPAVLEPLVAGRWLEGYDIPGTLARVTCPALFLQGDFAAGGALPDDYAAGLVAHLPDCAHVRLPGVGHAIHGTRPADFLRITTEFLESLDDTEYRP